MKSYLDLVRLVLEEGERKSDRTNTGTLSYFGHQLRFDLREGFPLVTTKKIYFDSMLRELLWFIKGATNIHDGLAEYTKIWNPWADESGELGPIYGYQWRRWPKYVPTEQAGLYRKEEVDQLKGVIQAIKTNPSSRRHIVSSWNVSDLDKMALPPCHAFFQFYVSNGYLDCQLYQRSADLALGVPFNIASYSLLLMMVAQDCALTPRYFIHTFGDVHIYLNHVSGLKKQLERAPRPLPQVKINKKPFFDLVFEDVELLNYAPKEAIKFPIAV